MRIKLFSTILGIFFVLAGMIVIFIFPQSEKGPDVRKISKTAFVDQFSTTSGSDGKNGYVAVMINTDVSYPTEVSLGNTILVELKATIKNIRRIRGLFDQGVNQFSTEDLKKNTDRMLDIRYGKIDESWKDSDWWSDFLAKRELKAKLSAAGLDVQPSDYSSIDKDMKISWTVRPKSTGEYKFLIDLKGKTAGSMMHPSVDLEYGRIVHNIKVNRKEIDLYTIWGWVSSFLGSLLTLPGILAFLEARREKRSESKNQ